MRLSPVFVFGFLGPPSPVARLAPPEFCVVVDCGPQDGRHG